MNDISTELHNSGLLGQPGEEGEEEVEEEEEKEKDDMFNQRNQKGQRTKAGEMVATAAFGFFSERKSADPLPLGRVSVT